MDEEVSRDPHRPKNIFDPHTMFLNSSSGFLFLSLQVLTLPLELRQGFISGMVFISQT